MAVWTEENVIPSLIENTIMVKRFSDGVHKTYRITPCEGYVLHDNYLDQYEEWDDEGNGIGDPILLGFYAGTRSVRYDYDFVVNPREFYAVLENEIPEGSEIYNVPSSDHEIM